MGYIYCLKDPVTFKIMYIGKIIPMEQRKMISETLKGRSLPEEVKAKLRGRRIKSICKTTNREEIYLCLSDAARALNCNKGPISNVLNGKQKSAYNYFWEYLTEDIVGTYVKA